MDTYVLIHKSAVKSTSISPPKVVYHGVLRTVTNKCHFLEYGQKQICTNELSDSPEWVNQAHTWQLFSVFKNIFSISNTKKMFEDSCLKMTQNIIKGMEQVVWSYPPIILVNQLQVNEVFKVYKIDMDFTLSTKMHVLTKSRKYVFNAHCLW